MGPGVTGDRAGHQSRLAHDTCLLVFCFLNRTSKVEHAFCLFCLFRRSWSPGLSPGETSMGRGVTGDQAGHQEWHNPKQAAQVVVLDPTMVAKLMKLIKMVSAPAKAMKAMKAMK